MGSCREVKESDETWRQHGSSHCGSYECCIYTIVYHVSSTSLRHTTTALKCSHMGFWIFDIASIIIMTSACGGLPGASIMFQTLPADRLCGIPRTRHDQKPRALCRANCSVVTSARAPIRQSSSMHVVVDRPVKGWREQSTMNGRCRPTLAQASENQKPRRLV